MTEPKLESTIQKRILFAIGRLKNSRIFRVNTGLAWTGTIVRKTEFTITLQNYRPLHAGMVKGGSDLIGWKSIVIGPEHIGMTIAQFVALECKTKTGRTTDEQDNFLRVVKAAGGVAEVIRSEDEALKCLR